MTSIFSGYNLVYYRVYFFFKCLFFALPITFLFFFFPANVRAQQTTVTPAATVVRGKVVDAVTNKPLSFITVAFPGSQFGTSTNAIGEFKLSGAGAFSKVAFSFVGYQTVTKTIKSGQVNDLVIRLSSSQTQLKEVSVVSGKKAKYRNKGNPAVELIQQVIDHKSQNRMQSGDYLQYNQYERIGLSLFNLPKKFVNGSFFSKYKFMLDSSSTVNGQKQATLPVFFSEKIYQNYYRKNPEKNIRILQAEKGINIIKFIDTAGVETYLNRLYGNNIDIYENNIFVMVNEFLSPIADHAPNFYKFFITDTIATDRGKLARISFTPRAKGDLLFEGYLLVTLDGRYAVDGCELNVNKQININFMRSLTIKLDFRPYPDGRYYLTQTNVKADFGISKSKGTGVIGERTVSYYDYKLNTPQPSAFYNGKSLQAIPEAAKADTAIWAAQPADSTAAKQTQVYARINRLQNMPSFKRLTWFTSTFTTDYAKVGPLQAGPVGSLYSYDTQEGSRFQLGARTTPEFNKTIYLDGFTAYGLRDQQFKYELNTIFALNKVAPYRFPNDYFKVGYSYDVDLPGQNFSINSSQAALGSFQTGGTDYWLYNKIFSLAYVKDFENHFSYNVTFRNWNQQAAGSLRFRVNDQPGTIIRDLTTSEINIGLRFAPHEQLIQGSQSRRTIKSPYPIYNLFITQGMKGVFNGAYNYTNITANIYKRFYLSQLGYADVTLLGGYLIGKIPFPLLNISPANQSISYDRNAYNKMYYLEFVSDHYAGLNYTQSFNGFFLNKIPLIKHLKWREYLSGKILYGGLRAENNPLLSVNLYQFPTGSKDSNGTYGLGSTPYVEAGVGLGNIFKLLRFDIIKRFNYLDHPGISPYGLKLSIRPDL
ncbi:DUF5686 and carboxypeptidase-like regulatory domain-containing protein [Mucilaginibacter glaciei]|uniref:Carboxypeptidase-like regulatory domain-containing protein n=1 Tax=Mucilaginibacter glaciei TaxID=2772109 RepID=A0A926S2V8_9SPHI|nr:DUF5686 and carboxypeptidase-like regulatory domain-containing protein [Mucilaginibacter glaciei]MBD1393579.1 carboxypeptidase-like regulatory domain-containing protein [Mucilaginibacter glaciei]